MITILTSSGQTGTGPEGVMVTIRAPSSPTTHKPHPSESSSLLRESGSNLTVDNNEFRSINYKFGKNLPHGIKPGKFHLLTTSKTTELVSRVFYMLVKFRSRPWSPLSSSIPSWIRYSKSAAGKSTFAVLRQLPSLEQKSRHRKQDESAISGRLFVNVAHAQASWIGWLSSTQRSGTWRWATSTLCGWATQVLASADHGGEYINSSYWCLHLPARCRCLEVISPQILLDTRLLVESAYVYSKKDKISFRHQDLGKGWIWKSVSDWS